MSDYRPFENSPYPKTCEALASAGIDPRIVAVDGFGNGGYNRFELNPARTHKIIVEGESVMIFEPWTDVVSKSQWQSILKTWRDEAGEAFL